MSDLTYHSYLQLDKILSAQKTQSPHEHDETLFIIIHQTYELWFKQLLHEGAYLQNLLEANKTFESFSTLKRILKILKTLVGQIDILETMTPLSFSSFRDRLETASGFQSWQFRCFEAMMGIKNLSKINYLDKSSEEYRTTMQYIESKSLYDSFLIALKTSGHEIPEDVLTRDFKERYEGDSRVQEILLSVNKEQSDYAVLSELFIDVDEGFLEWRYKHVKMVERTIGDKGGTGGSLGARYLQSTLSKPAFVDLWAIRSLL